MLRIINLVTIMIPPILANDLCSGCGACYAICPFDAIDMRLSTEGAYRPSINFSICKNCGLCEKACPSIIDQTVSVKSLGTFIRCYTGYSTDKYRRWVSSSGGVATEILYSLFDAGTITGAIVLKNNKQNALAPEMVLVKNKEELQNAVNSKYCPVKPCFKVKDLIRHDGQIAVVGLPCHISGFRKIEEINNSLKQKILVHIGLLCGKCPNSYATTYFLRKKAIVNESSVVNVSYRGNGWPGKFRVETNQGIIRTFELGDWCRFSYYPHFIPVRCVVCPDLSNQFADLSLGDAWGIANDQIGTSVIITRTTVGEQILHRLFSENKLILNEVSSRAVFNGQGMESKIKTSLIRAYLWKKCFRKPIPFAEVPLRKFSKKGLIMNLGYCGLLYLAQNPFMRAALCNSTKYLSKLIKDE